MGATIHYRNVDNNSGGNSRPGYCDEKSRNPRNEGSHRNEGPRRNEGHHRNEGSHRSEGHHGHHNRSVFSDSRGHNSYRPYPQQMQPLNMSDKINSIQNSWNKITGKFADLFTGATSKKEIRQTKREAKAELREKFRSGEISRKEYRALKKQLRQAKRAAKRSL